jgi:prophage regulatory protein
MFNNALGGINMQHTILRLPQIIKRTGLSRSSIYLRMANDEFPESVSLGGRAVGWLENDIDEWIVEKIEQGRINDHG